MMPSMARVQLTAMMVLAVKVMVAKVVLAAKAEKVMAAVITTNKR